MYVCIEEKKKKRKEKNYPKRKTHEAPWDFPPSRDDAENSGIAAGVRWYYSFFLFRLYNVYVHAVTRFPVRMGVGGSETNFFFFIVFYRTAPITHFAEHNTLNASRAKTYSSLYPRRRDPFSFVVRITRLSSGPVGIYRSRVDFSKRGFNPATKTIAERTTTITAKDTWKRYVFRVPIISGRGIFFYSEKAFRTYAYFFLSTTTE